MEGAADPPRIGEVRPARDRLFPPVVVVDGVGEQVEPVTLFLRDLALSDMGRLTCRSYAFDLLRWFRFLWALDVSWESASSGEVAVMVGWMKTARNPQRATRSGKGRGAVNLTTGKALLGARLRAADGQPHVERGVALLRVARTVREWAVDQPGAGGRGTAGRVGASQPAGADADPAPRQVAAAGSRSGAEGDPLTRCGMSCWR